MKPNRFWIKNLQKGQHWEGCSSAEDDRADGDEAGGGEEHLPDFRDRVADRQGEGHGPAKAREPHHVLELKHTKLYLFYLLNLFYSILPSIYSTFSILFLLSLVSALLFFI